MGFRFRRSLTIVPGVRLNIGKKGIGSLSIGEKGMTTNVSRKGARATYSLPGTGLSYQTQRASGWKTILVPLAMAIALYALKHWSK